jgi:hypothetical protein
MTIKKNLTKMVIPLYLLLGFFSFPHLIDDFLFGIPDEFGLSMHTTQILSGIFIVFFMLVLWGLALEKRSGSIGGIVMGSFLALAGILKHIPLMIKPGPYWSGWFSEGLIIGMIVTGITLAVVIILSLIEN